MQNDQRKMYRVVVKNYTFTSRAEAQKFAKTLTEDCPSVQFITEEVKHAK